MFMEKAANGEFYNFAATQYSDWWETGTFHSADWSSMRMCCRKSGSTWKSNHELGLWSDAAPRPAEVVEPTGRTIERGFGSAHPGTVTAVLGDGSVHSISLSANVDIVNSLGIRNDGLNYSLDSLN